MSRRTRAFLLALFILAIPLALLAVSPLLQRINATPAPEALVQASVEARLTQIAQGTPTAGVEQRVEATLTAVALPTATPRAGIEGAADSVANFAQANPLLACCGVGLLLAGALYAYSVAKYGE
jgi:hypothetical protein